MTYHCVSGAERGSVEANPRPLFSASLDRIQAEKQISHLTTYRILQEYETDLEPRSYPL